LRERAEELFDELIDRRLRGERIDIEAFLDSRTDLLEVECEELRAFASTLEVSWVREAFHSAAPAPLPEAIGPYRVVRRLGRGGQGSVYLAEDVRDGRRAALKVLPQREAGEGSASAIARLRREAELVSRLDHPGICKVYELGTQDGEPYVAMQYVEGETLARWIVNLRERGVGVLAEDVERALEIAERAARALHTAHEAGVVHRDVKPGNIMLAADGEVVLLDFGLAKGTGSGGEAVTQTGQLLGSPAFMSPEQLVPNGAELDARTDVYSLGVTLFECLTLRRPFDAAEQESLFQQIRLGGPPDPRSLNPQLDRRFRVLLEKALELDRRRRYPSALALADDLARLRRGEPLTARAKGPVQRTARWVRAHPRGAAAAVTLLALAGCLFLTLLFWKGQHQARLEAGGDRLLTQARALLTSNPYAALLLAIEGAERAPGLTATNALLDVLGEQCERRMLQAHDASLSRCLRGPGGRTLITASDDHTLKVWDATTWELVHTLRGHAAAVCDAVTSRDGKWLASVSLDGNCRVWRTDTWSCTSAFACGPGPAPRIAGFDALGRLLTTDGDGALEVWDAQRGELQHVLGAREGELASCAVGADGRLALSLVRGGSVRVWELGSEPRLAFEVPSRSPGGVAAAGFDLEGRRLLVVAVAGGASLFDLATRHEAPLESLAESCAGFAFAPQGGPLLVGRSDGSAGLWDPDSGAHLRELRDCTNPLAAGVFGADGARLLTWSGDSVARLWDTATGQKLGDFRGHEGNLVAGFFEPVAQTLVTAASDGTLREWELEPEACRSTLLLGKQGLLSAHFDRAGQRVVCAGADGWVQVIELPSRRTLLELQACCRELHGVVFAAHDTRLLSASSDRTARLWDAASGAQLLVLQHPAPVWDAQGSADGRRILTAAEDGRARLWDASTGRVLLELVGHEGGVRCARFVGDGTRILTCSETEGDGSLRLWDAASGAELEVLRAEGARPISISTDPSGRHALAVGWWGSAQLWDLERATLVRAWQAHTSHGFGCAFSPDGTRMLTSGARRLARIWDVADGAELMTLEDCRNIQSCSEFSPDGRWILTASRLGRLRLWPADPLARARELVTRELPAADRARLGL